MAKILCIALAGLLMVSGFIAGCIGEKNDVGELTVSVKDSYVDYDEVWITFTEVRVQCENEDDDNDGENDEHDDDADGDGEHDNEEVDFEGKMNLSIMGEVLPGNNVTLLAEFDGEPVTGAEVWVNDAYFGNTNTNGMLNFTVPNEDELEIDVKKGELRGELEYEFDNHDGNDGGNEEGHDN